MSTILEQHLEGIVRILTDRGATEEEIDIIINAVYDEYQKNTKLSALQIFKRMDTPIQPDIRRPKYVTQNSRKAHKKAEMGEGKLKIVKALLDCPNMCDFEIVASTGIQRASVCGHVKNLRDDGILIVSGQKLNPNGNQANAYSVVEEYNV